MTKFDRRGALKAGAAGAALATVSTRAGAQDENLATHRR